MEEKNNKRGRPTGSKNKAKKTPPAKHVDTFTKQLESVVKVTKPMKPARPTKAVKPKKAAKKVSKPQEKKKKSPVASIIKTATGARRESGVAGNKNSAFPAKFSLIPARGLHRLAVTCGEGFLKYGQGNWLNGFKETDLIDHIEAHLAEYKKGDKSEDHIAHLTWNAFALMHIQETEEPGSELLDLVPQTSRKEHQKNAKKK